MSIAEAAIRFGEAYTWPDNISSLVIDQLVGRTRRRLKSERGKDGLFAQDMRTMPIAVNTTEANAQHYEIPARFFEMVLGPQRKYSCCFYEDETKSLAEAEDCALEIVARNARLSEGQNILELGCGWGSLSLWMARRFPHSRITSVSNSRSQREYITNVASSEGLENLEVVTADMNVFMPPATYDRVVSIEMFEHMANWHPLLKRINGSLARDGYLFLHVFSHKDACYRFSTNDRTDWIARHFFTGGIMPSHQLVRQFSDVFSLDCEWRWNGHHYAKTARDWLANYDRRAMEISSVLHEVYGSDARLWQRRWRLFFLATMRLFGYVNGTEWGVSHYRLIPEK